MWVCALGAGSKTAKERLVSLEMASADGVKQHTAAERRITELENVLPLRSTVAQHEELAGKVTLLKSEIEQELSVVAMVKKTSEVGLRALSVKIDGIDNALPTLAKAVDVQDLSFRVCGLQSKLQLCQEDLERKATTTELEALLDRVGNSIKTVRQEAHNRSAEIEAGVGTIEANLEVQTRKMRQDIELRARSTDLQSMLSEVNHQQLAAVAKIDNRIDTETGRLSTSCVSLEKELTRLRIDLNAVDPRVGAAEESILRLVQTLSTKCDTDEVMRLKTRADALEAGFPAKADATVVAKHSLAIADQAAKLTAAEARQHEHHNRMDSLGNCVKDHIGKLQSVEDRARELHADVLQKADKVDVHPKDTLEQLLFKFYTKEEIDALLCRVWWRVGDVKSSPKAPYC